MIKQKSFYLSGLREFLHNLPERKKPSTLKISFEHIFLDLIAVEIKITGARL